MKTLGRQIFDATFVSLWMSGISVMPPFNWSQDLPGLEKFNEEVNPTLNVM
jgi:hypothetical protein